MLLLLAVFMILPGASFAATDPLNVFVAPQSANSISGQVSNDRRSPIPDLQVELLDDVDSVIQRTKTDSAGFFAFRRLTV
ncbi:MAG: carboxypeptidase-like regulatory domain-containing protein, partial [Pyrinomonadaceae bacterium]